MYEIRLIAVDLDGTLVGPRDDRSLYGVLREKIERFFRLHGAVWAINTGRSLPGYRTVFEPLAGAGLRPDYVISRHAFIHSVMPGSFLPHYVWNLEMWWHILTDWIGSEYLVRQIDRTICGKFPKARTVYRSPNRLIVDLRRKDAAVDAAAAARELVRLAPHVLVDEYVSHIEVRIAIATKGLAVTQLSRHLGIPSENVLTVGDGLNDLSMMSPSVAGMTACPSNAHWRVKELVHARGGHISTLPALAGTVEALDAYLAGTVHGDLPQGWHRERERNQVARKPRHYHQRTSLVLFKEVFVVTAAVAVPILALASVGAFGRLSPWITWPVEWAILMVGKLTGMW